MKKLAVWALLILGLVPLLVAKNTLSPMVDGKVVAYRGVAFLVTFCATFLIFHKKYSEEVFNKLKIISKTPLFIGMTVSTVFLIVSTFFAYDPFIAFFGNPSRGEGFLTLFSLYILYVGMTLFFEDDNWKTFFSFSTVSGIIIFSYSVIQLIKGIGRPYSFIGNPIPLAAFYLFSFFSSYFIIITGEKKNIFLKVLGCIGIVTSILGIFITKTRGTILALVIGSLVTLVLIAIYGEKSKKVLGFSINTTARAALILLLLLTGTFVLTRNAALWQRIPGISRFAASTVENSTIQSRLIFYEITGKGFVKSTASQKLIGWGWDNYEIFWQKNYEPKVYAYDKGIADRAHNKLGDMLIMTGAIGLLIYLYIWLAAIKSIRVIWKKNLPLAMGIIFFGVSYFIHNLFAFDIPVILMSFYALLAFQTKISYAKK